MILDYNSYDFFMICGIVSYTSRGELFEIEALLVNCLNCDSCDFYDFWDSGGLYFLVVSCLRLRLLSPILNCLNCDSCDF